MGQQRRGMRLAECRMQGKVESDCACTFSRRGGGGGQDRKNGKQGQPAGTEAWGNCGGCEGDMAWAMGIADGKLSGAFWWRDHAVLGLLEETFYPPVTFDGLAGQHHHDMECIDGHWIGWKIMPHFQPAVLRMSRNCCVSYKTTPRNLWNQNIQFTSVQEKHYAGRQRHD